jgi:OOP family OmpA-OmpF porin
VTKSLHPLAAAAALLSSSAAFAQIYIGAGIGQAAIADPCTGAASCTTSKADLKFFGGYRLTPNWAAELNYFGFGQATRTGAFSPYAATIKSNALGMGAAYFGAFSPKWVGVARLGIARVKADVSGLLGEFSSADSATSVHPYFGFGLGYALSRTVMIEADFDTSSAKYGGSSNNVRLLSAGLTYSF